MAKLLVTGGNGFVGRSLVQKLKTNFEVTYTSRADGGGIKLDLVDSSQFQQYEGELHDVEVLVHAAAKVNKTVSHDLNTNYQEHVLDNLTILHNLLTNLPNLKKVIFISSIWAQGYKDDDSLYGLGKFLAEETLKQIAHVKHIQCTILRLPQIYGPSEPHDIFVSKFIKAIQNGDQVSLTAKGKSIRDLIFIEDVVGSVQAALDSSSNGIFTITDREAYTIKEILDSIGELLGKEPNFVYSDNDLPPDGQHFTSTADKLGYTLQYSLHEGLQQTIQANGERT